MLELSMLAWQSRSKNCKESRSLILIMPVEVPFLRLCHSWIWMGPELVGSDAVL